MAYGLCPDIVILNARVRTMDPSQPLAEAIALAGNRVAAVGPTREIRALAGPGTRVIDAAGRLVLPGFNDAHVHFLMGGFSLSNVDLRSARSPKEMAERLREYAARLPRGAWVLGGEWDHENWPGAPSPTREMIDAATPDHPVLVRRLDGHMVLANSLALKLAGVTNATADPPGGLIVRDAKGEPTGLLKDAAELLVTKVIPEFTFEQKRVAALAATRHAASLGVTSLTDMSADADVGLYQRMAEGGELKTRVYCATSIVSWETLARAGVRAAFGSDLLRVGAVKGFADGSLGSSTALFFEPYADAPQNRGLLFDQMLPEGAMLSRVEGADRAGLQVMIHAIGDEANARILAIYGEVARRGGPRDRRFRIEHAQHLRAADIRRFGAQQVIASVQPYHLADDGRWCVKRIGRERAKGAYAFRSLLGAGAVLAFGSDWTVAPLNPLLGIHAAVTRQTLDGQNPSGWFPDEKLSVEESVRAYTVGAAYAEFAERVKGTLTPGKLADLVILEKDIFSIPAEQIAGVRVSLTIVDGQVVFESDL